MAAHYIALFGDDPALLDLRKAYAMKNGTVVDAENRRALTAFIWWSAWSAVTERPGGDVTYTNNWPHEPLVGNTPPSHLLMWTVFSVLFLIAGIALLGWHHARHKDEAPPALPASDPLAMIRITPSMRATAKYFWLVIALFLTQILLGAITAHYQVEGQEAYGFPLANILPYSLTRTWHTQLAVLWIATAWLGMGLYIGPAISGHEPKYQRLGVNVLFTCLLIIVVGAFTGQWLAVMQKLGLAKNFWFGHQGWEYVDLGRFWQIFLFAGLGIWLTLVGRALWPAIRKGGESKSIIALLFASTVCIGLFYGAGLMWGEHTHLSMVEYWRWWVVHLWVEGFFEVFATAVIAFLFTRLGLLRVSTATTAVLFATIVFLSGGVLGTLHHLYFTGTPTAVIALGASFSALEVVPLAFIGFEAYHTFKLGQATPWMQRYRWPILFFTAVAFWNVVGAGLFGFLINPPLPLYYMQGLNLTPLHGHTALFGVYGFLGIGLMLFCLRGLRPHVAWNERVLKTSFWAFNIGLAGMALLTLLPIGIIQLNGAHRARLLVRALGGAHAEADHPAAGVDARAGRHDLQRRRAVAGVVRAAAVDRAAPRHRRRWTARRCRGREHASVVHLPRERRAPAGRGARTACCSWWARPTCCAAMAWWAAWLVAARWHGIDMPQPPLPAGWMHAIIMQYQVLPSFIFGFLLTVFPRWLSLPALTPRHYLPVGVGCSADSCSRSRDLPAACRCCAPARCSRSPAGRSACSGWRAAVRPSASRGVPGMR